MRLLLILLPALCACDPTFDFDQPLQFEFSDDVWDDQCKDSAMNEVKGFLASAAAQLGTSISDTTLNPVIRVERLTECGAVIGRGKPGLIRLCREFLCNDAPNVSLVVKHELGHALGGDHISCGDGSILCDSPIPILDGPDYSAADIAEICRHNRGGVCR